MAIAPPPRDADARMSGGGGDDDDAEAPTGALILAGLWTVNELLVLRWPGGESGGASEASPRSERVRWAKRAPEARACGGRSEPPKRVQRAFWR